MTRLSIELTEQQHHQIKTTAALQGKSLTEYAVERLLPMTEDEQKAMTELKAFVLPRIERARRGEVSPQSFDEIVDEALREDNAA